MFVKFTDSVCKYINFSLTKYSFLNTGMISRNTKYDAPNIHFISYTFSIMSLKEPKSLSVEIMNRKLTLLLF